MLTRLLVGFVAGVFSLTLIEYLHHRVGGHTRYAPRLRASHQAHHRDPQEGGVRFPTKVRQRVPLVLGVLGFVALAALPWLAPPTLAGLLGGLVAGYLYSEWYHHRMHHRPPRTRVGAWLRRFHYIHHFVDPRVNYGFSTPLWDYLLGTARSSEEVTIPADRVPEGLDPGMGFALRELRRGAETGAARGGAVRPEP